MNVDVTRSIASELMSHLTVFRNADGREENWWLPVPRNNPSPWSFAGKAIVAEIGFGLIAVVATVETCVYCVFTLLALPLNANFYEKSVKLLESSAFTILWSVSDAIIYNPFFLDVHTDESFARYFANIFNPTTIRLYRTEDSLFIAEWRRQHQDNGNHPMLGQIVSEAMRIQNIVNDGVQVIREIFDTINDSTRASIREYDAELPTFDFLISKAIYLYAVGDKSGDQRPAFLNHDKTNKGIVMLQHAIGPMVNDRTPPANGWIFNWTPEEIQKMERYKRLDPEARRVAVEEIGRILGNTRQENQGQPPVDELALFATGPQNPIARDILGDIRAIASEEQQGSMFITGCLRAYNASLNANN